MAYREISITLFDLYIKPEIREKLSNTLYNLAPIMKLRDLSATARETKEKGKSMVLKSN